MKLKMRFVLAILFFIGGACGKKKEGPREEAPPAVEAPAAPNANPPVDTPTPPDVNVSGDNAPGVTELATPSGIDAEFDIPTTKTVTGSKSKDGLIYTGAGSDSILESLRQKESQLSGEQQQRNREFADQIASVEWIQDEVTRESLVHLRVWEGSDIVHFNFKSVLDGNLVSRAVVVNQAYGQKTNGSLRLSAQIKCLDLVLAASRCSTAVMNIKSARNAVSAKIILRDSLADIHFVVTNSRNPEQKALRAFLQNSVELKNTSHRIDRMYLQTFEVLNGQSGFVVDIFGFNHEYLGFSGSLLAEEVGNRVQARADKKIWSSVIMEARGFNNLTYNILSTLGDVRLVANNGQGKIQLRIYQRPYGNYPMEETSLTVMRRASAVIELGESSLLFE